LDRKTFKVVDYRAAQKNIKLVPQRGGLATIPTSTAESQNPILHHDQLRTVGQTALSLEKVFSCPQDCEWTWRDGQLILLQTRPVTTVAAEDDRAWYLNLHRSLVNLKQLQLRIETEIMPGMEAVAVQFAQVDLENLADGALEQEFRQRLQQQQYWEEAYRSDCIPMAHGIRLFGEFYNDTLQPQDPFEFLELLRGGELRALERNRRMAALASRWAGGADN
jgi:pyruvate,water dikinase